ncbi:MAG: hypothetical protein ACKPKO_61820, partial [Candidatus Fonsibacter sp.]
MQAAKVVDFYGCLLGHCIEIADAEQAYIQAGRVIRLGSVFLTRPDWRGGRRSFLIFDGLFVFSTKALYGCPDAGTYWGKKCDAHIKSVGFVSYRTG